MANIPAETNDKKFNDFVETKKTTNSIKLHANQAFS